LGHSKVYIQGLMASLAWQSGNAFRPINEVILR